MSTFNTFAAAIISLSCVAMGTSSHQGFVTGGASAADRNWMRSAND